MPSASSRPVIYGVDPGPERSAVIMFNGDTVTNGQILDNAALLALLSDRSVDYAFPRMLVVEQISMGGMIAGAEIFETCFWTGRFVSVWPETWERIKRKDVKLHLCGNVRAQDANIRQAIIDRVGPGKEKAIGSKKAPGPLYHVKSHLWAALAVALTCWDTSIGV